MVDEGNRADPCPLTDEERDRYSWQLAIDGFGEEGQQRLRDARVLVSRCGGVGGIVALQLAAAGVGRIVLAHAGDLRLDDLNRQVLMDHEWIGRPRVQCLAQRLAALNPALEVRAVEENVSDDNAQNLVEQVDLVVDCAPLFEERFAMNRACLSLGRPMVECAMYDMQASITSLMPGKTPCLECLVPEAPPSWTRNFPVLGAVSGTIGCMGAMEAIKILSRTGTPLNGRMLIMDLRTVTWNMVHVQRDPTCGACRHRGPSGE